MKRKRKPTIKFYIIVAVVLGLIVLGVSLIFRGPDKTVMETGTIIFQQDLDIIIIRDEEVTYAEKYGKAAFSVREGARVTQGSDIAEVYTWGFNEDLLKQLITVQQKIKDYQENTLLNNIPNRDINVMNAQIKKVMEDISSVLCGESNADLVTLEQELSRLMENKRQFLKVNTMADNYINELYQQENALIQQIAEIKTKIYAHKSGIVSYSLDGAEGILTPDTLETVTRAEIDKVTRGVTVKQDTNSTTMPLYRLVNNFEWYCLIVADKGKPVNELRKGTKFLMTIEGFLDRPYEAEVINTRELEDGSKLYTLKMTEDMGPLINVRTAKATLRHDFTGVKVPLEGIFELDGKKGLKVINGSITDFIEVQTLISDGKYAIVEPVNEGEELIPSKYIMLR